MSKLHSFMSEAVKVTWSIAAMSVGFAAILVMVKVIVWLS